MVNESSLGQTRDGVVLPRGYSHAFNDRSIKSRTPILKAFAEVHECLKESYYEALPYHLLSLVAFAFVPRSQASAASGRVTKGDVEAILQTVTSGGGIIFHNHAGSDYRDYPFAAITPLSFHSGTHYCVDDWH